MSEVEHTGEEVELTMTVGRAHSKGFSPREIAAELDMTPGQVNKHIQKYGELLAWSMNNNADIAQRVGLIVEETNDHFKELLKEAWNNKKNAEWAEKYGTVNQALKLVLEIQEKRLAMFKDLAKNEDQELLQQMEEQQERQDVLIAVLKSLKDRFPQAAAFVQDQLRQIDSGELEVLEVRGD